MTKEQEQAIEIINKMLKSYIEADECRLTNDGFKHEIRAMQTVLNMLQEQQEENKKKDKIIDYMIDWIRERSIYAVDSHDMLKQYFERKVEE